MREAEGKKIQVLEEGVEEKEEGRKRLSVAFQFLILFLGLIEDLHCFPFSYIFLLF